MPVKNLKISIVAHGLRAGGGISVGKNFIASLTNIMHEAAFQIFIPKDLGYENVAAPGVNCEWNTYESRSGTVGRWLYDEHILPRKVQKFAPDIVICLGNIGIRRTNAPQILLLQDSHYFYPEVHYARVDWIARRIYRYKRHRFRNDLKRTDVLLCQTNTAISRVREEYNPGCNIALMPNAVSVDSLAGLNEISHENTLVNSKEFKLFYLSRYYPHKNFEIFLALFEKYRNELADAVLYVTILESQHRGAKKFLSAVRQKNLSRHIVNIGPVLQKDIASYFRMMNVLVMPTTLESFSATYLEAMAFNCPILTSDLDFAHEICGDAALYFDPWSVESLFQALSKLRANPELAAELVEKGNQILSKSSHTWEQNARIVCGVIENLLRG